MEFSILRKAFFLFVTLCLAWSVSAFAEVNLSSPLPGTTVPTSVHFVASAASNLGLPTSSMIINVDGVDRYLTYTNSLDTTLTLDPGWRQIVI